MEFYWITLLVVFAFVLGAVSTFIFYIAKKDRFHNKVSVPPFDNNKPYYVAIDHQGDIYSFRRFYPVSDFSKSTILQEWADEAASVEAMSFSELQDRLSVGEVTDKDLSLQLAALKEDMKTLEFNGEHQAVYDLFVERTRELIGHKAQLPEGFNGRSCEEIKADLYR
ncbi:TPA: hypothetical protein KDZ08_004807 [Vibrio parahaemolyticus]|uniref:hypothetical protein n=1 Tax=Vibrio TaxID=662 RepID=UPI001B8250FD|nr:MULTISPECIES: hypothetical protein [Vibrio]BDP38548.1 hypothetical protein VA208B3_49190 [Vibrio alginolyticus]MCR9820086.1 hypothetical protein [Vibrio parahaemolyticus]BDP33563.1 hypothetical protein VV208B2_46430 [Vibrio vulnificus]HBC3540193.1 hypothetical protein [Vibrio parahaemolyticus]HBC3592906.1 hypothetical protein [Vibrio parahaemolyticus]